MVYEVHSTIIFPGSWVSDFAGNLHAWKLNKAQTKPANITGVQYFSLYQHGVVSSTSSFIIYHLSSLYLPHNFVSNFPFLPPPPPKTEHDAPSARTGIQFCTIVSLTNLWQGQPNDNNVPCRFWVYMPTTALPETHPLSRLPPPPTKTSPPTLAINRQPIPAMGFKKIPTTLWILTRSALHLVSQTPPSNLSSLKPASDRPLSLRVVGQDDNYDEDSEEESEKYYLGYNP